MGAWIEILILMVMKNLIFTVAPLVGAWIEINKQDWKKIGEFGSLLSWERGLKYRNGGNNMKRKMSLLSWERGLKYGV